MRPTMRQTFGVSDKVEQLLRGRRVESGVWTVDAFHHERITAENDPSRLLSMSRIKPHAHVVSGLENLPWTISDKYRLPRAGKLQISFD